MTYTFEEAKQALTDGCFKYSKAEEHPDPENTTRVMWIRDERKNNPEVLFECAFKQPFDLHQGKGKPIKPDKVLSLELSLNQNDHAREIEYFETFDNMYLDHLINKKTDCFGKNINEQKIKFLLRPSLTPSEKTEGLYLLRTKVNKRTKIYVVTEYDGDIVTRYRKGSLADIFQGGGRVIPTITHLQGYTGTQAGSVHCCNKLLYFPYKKDENQIRRDDNQFPFSKLSGMAKAVEDVETKEEAEQSDANQGVGTNDDQDVSPQKKRMRK